MKFFLLVRKPVVSCPDGRHGQAMFWLSRKTGKARRHKIEGGDGETAIKTKGMYIFGTEHVLGRATLSRNPTTVTEGVGCLGRVRKSAQRLRLRHLPCPRACHLFEHPHHTLPFVMSHANFTVSSTSTSNYQLIIDNAWRCIRSAQKTTYLNIHPPPQLQSCESPGAILAFLP